MKWKEARANFGLVVDRQFVGLNPGMGGQLATAQAYADSELAVSATSPQQPYQ